MLNLPYSALLFDLFVGCLAGNSHPAAATQSKSLESGADSASDLSISGNIRVPTAPENQEFAYREPGTGIRYLINPRWKIMMRQPENYAKSAAALPTWTDWSGQVEIRIYECASYSSTEHQNSIGCQVEADFILIGGGAYAEYVNGPGALLWESRPLDPALSVWAASSKDHEVASPHRLFVYAFGLRLKDHRGDVIPKSLLQGYIRLLGHEGKIHSYAPDDSVGESSRGNPMLYFGIGARLNWKCCGALLTRCKAKYENLEMIGVVAGKNHRYPDPSTIDAFGVATETDVTMAPALKSMRIPGFGRLEFKMLAGTGAAVDSGVAVARLDVERGYVLAGIGGESVWTSGGGRMLFGMKPTGTHTGRIGIYSKDHRAVSAGYNVANLIQIRKAF